MLFKHCIAIYYDVVKFDTVLKTKYLFILSLIIPYK